MLELRRVLTMVKYENEKTNHENYNHKLKLSRVLLSIEVIELSSNLHPIGFKIGCIQKWLAIALSALWKKRHKRRAQWYKIGNKTWLNPHRQEISLPAMYVHLLLYFSFKTIYSCNYPWWLGLQHCTMTLWHKHPDQELMTESLETRKVYAQPT
jgi:hypothetical protein